MAEPQTKPSRWGWTNLQFRSNGRRTGPWTALELDGRALRVAQGALRGGRSVITRIAVAELALASEADRANPVAMGRRSRFVCKRCASIRGWWSSVCHGTR